MNYVFTKAIILFILLLIYLICQPKTLFEGMNSSSLKNKTVQSSDIENGKNPNFNVGDISWYNIDNPNVLYSSCETAASGENLDVSMCSYDSNSMNENDTSDDNSNANNSSGNNSSENNSSGNNSSENNSSENNSSGNNSSENNSNENNSNENESDENESSENSNVGNTESDKITDDSNNNYQKINQNYTFNITIPSMKPKNYPPSSIPVNYPKETYNDLIRPTMSTEAFSLPFNKY
tara:strand:- start:2462 stop:3172 length:711 start_codon:yes stop_codon:yes gene_type:complete